MGRERGGGRERDSGGGERGGDGRERGGRERETEEGKERVGERVRQTDR